MNTPTSRQLDNCITANEMWLCTACLSVCLAPAVRHFPSLPVSFCTSSGFFSAGAGIFATLICECRIHSQQKPISRRRGERRPSRYRLPLGVGAVGRERRGQVVLNKPWKSCLISWAVSLLSHMASILTPNTAFPKYLHCMTYLFIYLIGSCAH